MNVSKLREYKNQKSIELLGDMFDYVVEIAQDKTVVELSQKKNKLLLVRHILKAHSTALFNLLALIEGVPADEYECDIFTLPAVLLELFNQPEFEVLFQSQAQVKEETSTGSATLNTGAKAETI